MQFKLLVRNIAEIFNQLRNNARRLRQLLKGLVIPSLWQHMHNDDCTNRVTGLTICREPFSPIIHLQLTNPTGSRQQDEDTLQQIVDKV